MTATWATGKRRFQLERRRAAARRGFTLVELLVVIAIMTLLAGLFPVALDRMLPARRVAASDVELRNKLRLLQAEAISTGVEARVVVVDDQLTLIHPVAHVAEKIVLPRATKYALREVAGSRSLAELVLYPDGSSSGGMIELIDHERRASVQVTPLLGRIRLEKP